MRVPELLDELLLEQLADDRGHAGGREPGELGEVGARRRASVVQCPQQQAAVRTPGVLGSRLRRRGQPPGGPGRIGRSVHICLSTKHINSRQAFRRRRRARRLESPRYRRGVHGDEPAIAVDVEPRAVDDRVAGTRHADDGRDAELAGHDRGMALLGTDVDHNGRRAEEQRRPCRVGDRGDEDIARLDVARVAGIEDHPCRTAGHSPAHADAVERAREPHTMRWPAAQLPRIGVRDVALEPERRHARLQEVALLGALGDHLGEPGRVPHELVELPGGDQVAVATVSRTPARLGTGRQLVEHRAASRRARERTRPSPARVPRHRRWLPRVLDATPAGGVWPPSALPRRASTRARSPDVPVRYVVNGRAERGAGDRQLRMRSPVASPTSARRTRTRRVPDGRDRRGTNRTRARRRSPRRTPDGRCARRPPPRRRRRPP